MADPLEQLRVTIRSAADALRDGAPGSIAPTLERPPKPELGDYSTNAAMLLAPARGQPPREIAERLREELDGLLGGSADRIEVAGPGFVNVFLADRWHRESLAALLDAGDAFGRGAPERPERVLVEFVSANPTGPLTAAQGRHAAYGDSLARLLDLAGHRVEREYYLNDAGGQVRRFAESIAARMQGREPPEDGYQGEYVAELAERAGRGRRRPGRPRRPRPPRHRGDARADRGDAGALRRPLRHLVLGALAARGRASSSAAIEELRARGHVYESEGAVWLRTTRVRRRQGPGADPLRRRAHLLRRRHRLPPRQARARGGAPDRPARRRPPRLRAADAGGDRGARAPTRTASRRR